ncbi:MAG: benzoylformate decarboxylase [Segniliparus sp.]|uniref:benzoylformate decarboxylase n=1 Tax=Segniliparus sp. TaxID=2804064 RepID=UPI003F30794C
MGTVRDAVYAVLREHGATTFFGNPGSNELTFLDGLPEDFRYFQALHEGAAVSMADGYAQVSGRPAVVSLHSSSGTGNGMGMLSNAYISRSPLLLIAGQQVRATVGADPMLAIPRPTVLTAPFTGFSGEPLAASDVPRMVKEALVDIAHGSRLPAFLSIPYDDFDAPFEEPAARALGHRPRRGDRLAAADLAWLADQLRSAGRLALVAGSDLDGAADQRQLVEVVETLGADVWAPPSGYRLAFPNRHPSFRGSLPAAQRQVAELLSGYDLVVVLGAPVFRYHQHVPGTDIGLLTRLVHITDDARAAGRAAVGEALIAGLGQIVADLHEALGAAPGGATQWQPVPEPPASPGPALLSEQVFAAVRRAVADPVHVLESTSTVRQFFAQADVRAPRSYLFPASGGLGFGLSASIGAQLAVPGRQVVALIGDGSMNYTVSGLWTAARFGVPVLFVVLRNGSYQALRDFSNLLGTTDADYLSVAGLDFVPIARGYGVEAHQVASAGELEERIRASLGEDGLASAPLLLQVDTVLE